MSSIRLSDSHRQEPDQSQSVAGLQVPAAGLWRTLKHLWCRHRDTITTPKRLDMPAHVVCRSCGWREPVLAGAPAATRTWDSSRDEARYQLEKKRRTELEHQRQLMISRLATPGAEPGRRRKPRRGNVIQMNPAVGE